MVGLQALLRLPFSQTSSDASQDQKVERGGEGREQLGIILVWYYVLSVQILTAEIFPLRKNTS